MFLLLILILITEIGLNDIILTPNPTTKIGTIKIAPTSTTSITLTNITPTKIAPTPTYFLYNNHSS